MKKLFLILLSLALLVGVVPTMAYVAEGNYDNMEYQAVLEKLNAEYGTKTRFATSDELKIIGFEPEKIDVSPAEFEIEVLTAIEASKKANREALEASLKLQKVQIDESGSGICKPRNSISPMASYPYYHSKPVTGANVHLEAVVFDTGGFWKFSTIDSVWTTSSQSIPFPWFAAETYNYDLIDTRRTCAINLYGFTIDRYGVIVDPAASRYVEFWAGTNMGAPEAI